jgi:hypothetical protein
MLMFNHILIFGVLQSYTAEKAPLPSRASSDSVVLRSFDVSDSTSDGNVMSCLSDIPPSLRLEVRFRVGDCSVVFTFVASIPRA